MISFFICLALLIGGYFTYGSLVDRTFGPDDRETPAVKINDGVDYMVLPQWKLFMIQLLNIAGLGPIFGALSGALWGPVVFLWITFGTIFAGAVHDYFSGMLSERNEGASISEISGIYLGGAMKNVMRVFSVVLLIMVGTVFAVGPAGLIQLLFSNGGSTGILTNKLFWLVLILVYYFIATFLSIDKIIGKIYPVFGICLIIMAVGVAVGIFTKGYVIPEIWNNFTNMHPQGTQIQVVIQPASIIHSMIEYEDGAVIAQLGTPDMKLPIQYALYYPERRFLPGDRLDFTKLREITFDVPDPETFKGLKLAYQAGKTGGSMPTVFNAANEMAVSLFLKKKIPYLTIPDMIQASMEHHKKVDAPDVDQILAAEAETYDFIHSKWNI